MSKNLIVGDLHIGKGLSIGKPSVGNTYNSRIVDQINLLTWVLDLAIEESVENIILTGDIFEDLKPPYYQTKIFLDWLHKIQAEDINTHIIIGNHDITRTGTNIIAPALDLLNACDMEKVFIYYNIDTFETDKLSFTFIPFRDRRSLQCETHIEAINKIKSNLEFELSGINKNKKKIIVGHLALEGAIYIGDECDDSLNELMCPLDMFNGYDYVWMGHVHKPQVKNDKNPHIAHTGSLDLSDFGETDHVKNLILLDTSDYDFFKYIPIPSRPLRRLRVTLTNADIDSTTQVLELIKSQSEVVIYKDAIVKLEITLIGDSIENVNVNTISDFIYSLGAFYISGITESRQLSVVTAEKRDAVDNSIEPKVAIKMYAESLIINEDDKSEFINLCNSIVDEAKEKEK